MRTHRSPAIPSLILCAVLSVSLLAPVTPARAAAGPLRADPISSTASASLTDAPPRLATTPYGPAQTATPQVKGVGTKVVEILRRSFSPGVKKAATATLNTARRHPVATGLGALAVASYFSDSVQNAVARALAFLLTLASLVVGAILDFSGEMLNMILQVRTFGGDQPGWPVQLGWRFVRDTLNFLFLPALLAIAFSTIAGLDTYGMRRNLPRLLIAALLVNFSLAIGSGIVAASTYTMDALVGSEGSTAGTRLADSLRRVAGLERFYEEEPQKLADAIARDSGGGSGAVSITPDTRTWFGKWWDSITRSEGTLGRGIRNSLEGLAGQSSGGDDIKPFKLLTAQLLQLLILIVAAVVLAALAVLFIFRVVVLYLLLILSPIGIVFPIIPGLAGLGTRWWRTFLQYVFFGPAALAFVVLTTHMGNFFQQATNLPLPTGPGADIANMFFQAILIILFLLASLYLGRELGIYGAATALGIATRVTTGSALLLSGAGPVWRRTGAPFLGGYQRTQQGLAQERARVGTFGRVGQFAAAPFSRRARAEARRRDEDEEIKNLKAAGATLKDLDLGKPAHARYAAQEGLIEGATETQLEQVLETLRRNKRIGSPDYRKARKEYLERLPDSGMDLIGKIEGMSPQTIEEEKAKSVEKLGGRDYWRAYQRELRAATERNLLTLHNITKAQLEAILDYGDEAARQELLRQRARWRPGAEQEYRRREERAAPFVLPPIAGGQPRPGETQTPGGIILTPGARFEAETGRQPTRITPQPPTPPPPGLGGGAGGPGVASGGGRGGAGGAPPVAPAPAGPPPAGGGRGGGATRPLPAAPPRAPGQPVVGTTQPPRVPSALRNALNFSPEGQDIYIVTADGQRSRKVPGQVLPASDNVILEDGRMPTLSLIDRVENDSGQVLWRR